MRSVFVKATIFSTATAATAGSLVGCSRDDAREKNHDDQAAVGTHLAVGAGKCGNGTKDPGEACDDGNTVDNDACRNDCTAANPVKDSDGSSTRTLETSAACLTCEENVPACAALIDSCSTLIGNVSTLSGTAAGHGANLFAGQPKSLACNKVLECVRKTNCANVSHTDCICGIGVDAAACFNGDVTDANGDLQGPCVNEIAGALQVRKNQPASLLDKFVEPSLPGGAAMRRIVCDRANCAGGVVLGKTSNQTCFAP